MTLVLKPGDTIEIIERNMPTICGNSLELWVNGRFVNFVSEADANKIAASLQKS